MNKKTLTPWKNIFVDRKTRHTRQNRSKKDITEIARDLIIERCLIHGLPHIVDSKKSLWIRIFWGFLLFVSLGLYFYFMCQISNKFWIDPDISLIFAHRSIRELPFPAVTICSKAILKKKVMKGLTFDKFVEIKRKENFTSEVLDFVSHTQWCSLEVSALALKNRARNSTIDFIKNMKKLQIKLKDLMFDCTYRTKSVDCSKLFTRVLTEFGYCFTYNMQDHHAIFNEEISKDFDGYKKEEEENIQWTLDGGYNTDSDDVKPHRAIPKTEIGFKLKVPKKANNIFCKNIEGDFDLFLLKPNELITHQKSFHISTGLSFDISLTAMSLRTTEDVNKYPPDVRNCYLDGEKKLKFFKQYTENMCRLECLTNITLKECKCVKFSMPRDRKTKICVDYEEIKCMVEVVNAWSNRSSTCGCLNTCNDIKYFVNYFKEFPTHKTIDFGEEQGKQANGSELTKIKLFIHDYQISEDLKVCYNDYVTFLVNFAGLTGFFTGCSIISLLELAFFIVARRRQREETTQTESSLDEFVQSSSIEGAKCFHSSESKFVKIFWIFIFFLSFCGLGFYIFEIYSKCKLKPIIAEEISQVPMHDIPFPAMTLCHPLFARNVNLREFVSNPGMNLSFEEQTEMAANLQSCNPELGSKLAKYLTEEDSTKILTVLKSKFSEIEVLCHCSYLFQGEGRSCDKIWNYVLTDYGFCYTFNLEGFPTLFNTEVISDDFQCYKRDKLAQNYYFNPEDYKKTINEDNHIIQWTLEKGYFTKLGNVTPIRAKRLNKFCVDVKSLNDENLCPERGAFVSAFMHMPNEILTPFHKPYHFNKGFNFFLQVETYKTVNSLKSYPPSARDCYFDGERSLKFFKSYTKAHCEFECLTNFTLDVCGCVKFSMPREKSTPICGINQTSCYVEAMRNWSSKDDSKCDCLYSCTRIDYQADDEVLGSIAVDTTQIFAKQFIKSSTYGMENGLADFGGMLGVFFGASVISFIEIFYFCFIALIRKKFNIQVEFSESFDNSTGSSNIQESSEIADESTLHGIQFIFKPSLQTVFKLLWVTIFLLALVFGLTYARENYKKFLLHPEVSIKPNQRSIEEIPFPAVSFHSQYFTAGPHVNGLDLSVDHLENLTIDSFYYLTSNLFWFEPTYAADSLAKYNRDVLKLSDPLNYQSNVDFFNYFNRSHFDVKDIIGLCAIGRRFYDCDKVIRRVMTVNGMCYSFNMQSFHTIFNAEEISRNFDSYGRNEEEKESQWSLDQGYKVQNSTNPINASISRKITFFVYSGHREEPGKAIRTNNYFFIHLTNEMFLPSTKYYTIDDSAQTVYYLSAESTRANENIRRFKPENRGCFFENERKLQFFKTYTKSNCELECLTNLTLESCGCVSFILPHSDLTRTCSSPNDAKCYDKVRLNFPPLEDSLTPCGCLSTCNRIEYKIIEGKITHKEYYTDDLFAHERIPQLTQVTFVFDASKINENEIFVSYNFLDFIADVGGLLGLFLGCSMLSFFELIYYPTKFIVEKIKKKNCKKNHVVSLDVTMQEIHKDLTSNEKKETKIKAEKVKIEVLNKKIEKTTQVSMKMVKIKTNEDKKKHFGINQEKTQENEEESGKNVTSITDGTEKEAKITDKKEIELKFPSEEFVVHLNYKRNISNIEKVPTVIPGTVKSDE